MKPQSHPLMLALILASVLNPLTQAQQSSLPLQSSLAKTLFEKRHQDSASELTAAGEVSIGGLDMDCGTKTGYACQLYIQEYLDTYINVNKSYNKLLRPVEQEDDVLNIDIVVTFVELVDIDTKRGSMTVYVFIDYLWNDAFLKWDASRTDNDDFHVIPNNLIYIPDVIAYNTIGGYSKGLDAVAVFLDSGGGAWWSARGVITTSCHFDVSDFPFDTQHCHMDFSSWIFSERRINISNVYTDVLSSFDNLAWEVDDVTSARERVPLWGGSYIYTFGKYTVSLTRYHSYYLTSAVVPAIIIASLVLSSLWMESHANRLSMGITGFLTMTAIQWSVASELPISDSSNWLSRFLLASTAFIALCCVQCLASHIMVSRKHTHSPPRWVVTLIKFSLGCGLFGSVSMKHNHSDKEGDDSGVKQDTNNVLIAQSGIEMENVRDVDAAERNNSSSSSGDGGGDGGGGGSGNIEKCGNGEGTSFTWERGSRALDRISRVLIPTSYALFVAIELGSRL